MAAGTCVSGVLSKLRHQHRERFRPAIKLEEEGSLPTSQPPVDEGVRDGPTAFTPYEDAKRSFSHPLEQCAAGRAELFFDTDAKLSDVEVVPERARTS